MATLHTSRCNLPHRPSYSNNISAANEMNRRSTVFGSFKKNVFNKRHESNESTNPFAAAPPTRRPDRPNMNAFSTPSNEPPPAYSPPAPAYTPSANPPSSAPVEISSSPRSNSPSRTKDDPYSFLATFDTVFLIDDSGSMAGRSWRESALALANIAPVCTAHDADGIDLHFLNAPDREAYLNVTSAEKVQSIFASVRPGGGTPTGQRLNALLRPYLREVERNPDSTRPLNIIVITDGVPSDDVESVLIRAATKLDAVDALPWQVGVQFFQVGEEEGAREHLEQLDNELARMGGGCRDIVDTIPFRPGVALTGDYMLKVLLGAVNKRLDREVNSNLVNC